MFSLFCYFCDLFWNCTGVLEHIGHGGFTKRICVSCADSMSLVKNSSLMNSTILISQFPIGQFCIYFEFATRNNSQHIVCTRFTVIYEQSNVHNEYDAVCFHISCTPIQ